MNRKELIAKARAKARNKIETKAAETDSRGIPEVGGAPEREPVAKPEGEIEQQLDAAATPTDGLPAEGTPAEPPAAAPGTPAVTISNDSAVAVVKMKEQYDNLVKETEINEAVIKKMNDILKQAGLPIAAMQKHFNARAAYIAKITPVEAKRHMEAVAKARLSLKAMDEETDLTPEDNKDLQEIKVLLEMAVEKAEDAIAEVTAGKIGDHRKILAEAMRDAQAAVRQFAFWKKNLDFKDAVIDSITAVQEFVTAGKINVNAIFDEFDSLVSMTPAERRNIKNFKMSQTPNFVSQGIQAISSFGGRPSEEKVDPIARVGDLAMKALESEKVVVERV